jgi:hypothetical protein
MWWKLIGSFALLVTICVVMAAAQAVVTNGKFTNIYVYRPSFAGETWEQHIQPLRDDWSQFTRAKIDAFTDTLMTPSSPSYFDVLHQYGGINTPQFFGSGVALQRCVDAAMRDLHNNVMQWDTIRSLANCHNDGEDPSPQVALIFSPDIQIGKIPNPPVGTTGDMCTTTNTKGWHAWGLNMPNFIALPTDPKCKESFDDFTSTFSHEIVETLTDPGGFGVGGVLDDPLNVGKNEAGDRCQGHRTTWSGYTVTQYWSKASNQCEPRAFSPPVSTPEYVWLDVSGLPLVRFSDHLLDRTETVSPKDAGRQLQKLQLTISTGGDDLRGGDNCDVTIVLRNGETIALNNVNHDGTWDNWTINTIDIPLPSGGLKGGDVTGIKLHKKSGGDFIKSPDKWNVQRIQLQAWVQVPDKLGTGGTGPRQFLLTTTVTVTVGRIGFKPGTGLPGTGPREWGSTNRGSIYAMVRMRDSEFERSPFSQSVRVHGGDVPIQIQIWQNLPDYTPPPNCNDHNDPKCRPIRNAKAKLRELNIVYDPETHEFTVRGETGATLNGKAGVEFVFPGDGAHPELAFTISDVPGTR